MSPYPAGSEDGRWPAKPEERRFNAWCYTMLTNPDTGAAQLVLVPRTCPEDADAWMEELKISGQLVEVCTHPKNVRDAKRTG